MTKKKGRRKEFSEKRKNPPQYFADGGKRKRVPAVASRRRKGKKKRKPRRTLIGEKGNECGGPVFDDFSVSRGGAGRLTMSEGRSARVPILKRKRGEDLPNELHSIADEWGRKKGGSIGNVLKEYSK